MKLWICWWDAIWLLRQAFPRLRTFMWFAAIVAGMTIRPELMGVTSIIRATGLHERHYINLGAALFQRRGIVKKSMR